MLPGYPVPSPDSPDSDRAGGYRRTESPFHTDSSASSEMMDSENAAHGTRLYQPAFASRGNGGEVRTACELLSPDLTYARARNEASKLDVPTPVPSLATILRRRKWEPGSKYPAGITALKPEFR